MKMNNIPNIHFLSRSVSEKSNIKEDKRHITARITDAVLLKYFSIFSFSFSKVLLLSILIRLVLIGVSNNIRTVRDTQQIYLLSINTPNKNRIIEKRIAEQPRMAIKFPFCM